MKISSTTTLSCFVFLLAIFVICESSEPGFIKMKRDSLLGGIRDYRGTRNNGEIESIGRFAVQEHNKKENALLEFGRVIKAKEQVVSGKIYHLTLEAIDAGEKKIYEAKVWVKPWMNFKQLEEFRDTSDSSLFTSSDLGLKQGVGSEPFSARSDRKYFSAPSQMENAMKSAIKLYQSAQKWVFDHLISLWNLYCQQSVKALSI